jgi:hypothetical protein
LVISPHWSLAPAGWWLTKMPSLGLASSLTKANPTGTGGGRQVLYSDNLVHEGQGDYTFTSSQFFSTSLLGTTTENGVLTAPVGASGNAVITYFDAQKEFATPFDMGISYPVSEDAYYAGVYGHGQFKKTTGNASGLPPVFRGDATFEGVTIGAQAGMQDANGWTRVRPSSRILKDNQIVNFSFNYKLTGTLSTNAEVFRLGLFQSSYYQPATTQYTYVNKDRNAESSPANINQGNSANIWSGYAGYAFTFSTTKTLAGGVYRRIPGANDNENKALINTLVGNYTNLTNATGATNLEANTNYTVSLSIKREGTGLRVFGMLPGGRAFSFLDTTPVYQSFDTFVAYAAGNSCTSYEITNPIATLDY